MNLGGVQGRFSKTGGKVRLSMWGGLVMVCVYQAWSVFVARRYRAMIFTAGTVVCHLKMRHILINALLGDFIM